MVNSYTLHTAHVSVPNAGISYGVLKSPKTSLVILL